MNFANKKVKSILIKQKILSDKYFPCESREADKVIEDYIYDLVMQIIVFSVSSSVENFIMNFSDGANYEDGATVLLFISSSKRLKVTERILGEL
jgi:hypothetical protein